MARHKNRLERPRRGEGRVIAGVCAAIADKWGVSRLLIRTIFVIAGLVGAGEIVYLILWLVIPKARPRPAGIFGRGTGDRARNGRRRAA